jgi:hypothetical protein
MGQNRAVAIWLALHRGFGRVRRTKPARVGIIFLSAAAGSLCASPQTQAAQIIGTMTDQSAAADPIPATPAFTGSTSSSAGHLHVVDPFLLGQGKALANLNLKALLPNISGWSVVLAKGLVADNTSAAVVIFQTHSFAYVTFRTDNGTALLPYANNFLPSLLNQVQKN